MNGVKRSCRLMTAEKQSQSGFTLVEMLVVMTLTSVLMLALSGAMRGMAQAEVRVDQRLARVDGFKVATTFLRNVLGIVSSRRSEALSLAGKPGVMFEGQPNAVAWVGIMPARDGAGGRHFFRLSIEPTPGQQPGVSDNGVVIRFAPFLSDTAFPNWSAAESRVLAPQAQSMTIEYLDMTAFPPLWRADWTQEDRLPNQVRINVVVANGPWPVLYLPLRATAFSDGGSGGATFGGAAN